MKLITHLHLLLRLKMGGAVPPPLLYPLMAWTGINVTFFNVMYDYNWQPDVLRCMSECGNVL